MSRIRALHLSSSEGAVAQVVYPLHDDHVAQLIDQVVFHEQHIQLDTARR